MAGRKHHLQQLGYSGANLSKIEDPMERDFAFRTIQATPYCKHCGEQVLQSLQDKDGKAIDSEWEQKNQAHYNCYSKWKREMEHKKMVEDWNKAEKAANFDWDTYMKQMLDKKED